MAANSRQVLRRRIRSIRETSKVTRAMELIASARMRRAEQRAVSARPYADHLGTLMALAMSQPAIGPEHSMFRRPEGGAALVVHFTTDKGLCGGLNSRLNHALAKFVLSQSTPVRVATVGRKGRDFALRAGLGLVAEFSGLGDAPGVAALRPLCRLITDAYLRFEIDRVYLCYPRFVNVVTQEPAVECILPVDVVDHGGTAGGEVLFEPEPVQLLEHLVVRYVEASTYHAHLELLASEHSARLVAMHGATESAGELADAMTAELNRARQAAVTEEICDVSAGVEVLDHGGMND